MMGTVGLGWIRGGGPWPSGGGPRSGSNLQTGISCSCEKLGHVIGSCLL